MANSVADRIVVMLVAPGAKRLYGIAIDSLNGLTDTIHRQGEIEWGHELRARQSIRQQSLAAPRPRRTAVMPKTVADPFVETLVARSFGMTMQRRPKCATRRSIQLSALGELGERVGSPDSREPESRLGVAQFDSNEGLRNRRCF
jgi:hypothetical protein